MTEHETWDAMPESDRLYIGRKFKTKRTSAEETGRLFDERYCHLLAMFGVEVSYEIAEQEAYERFRDETYIIQREERLERRNAQHHAT